MDHKAAKELFSQYLDEELPPNTQSALKEHLAKCTSCQEEFNSLKKTLNSLAGLSSLPTPKEFEKNVQRRIRHRSRGRFFASENILVRIPFEWISFVLILLMLVMYFMVVLIPQKEVKPILHKETKTSKKIHQTKDNK